MASKATELNRPNWIGRILVSWISGALGILLVAWLAGALDRVPLWLALVVSALVGIFNAILWPIFTRFFLKITVFTFGLASLVFNGVIVVLAVSFLPGFENVTILDGIYVAIAITLVNTIVSSLLSIDDDESFYRNVMRRYMKRQRAPKTDKPGMILLEIDGLSRPVFEKALEGGYMPTLERWKEEGSHRLIEWETDLSSQTGASQAGILHGNNENMPAFRWVEKENDNRLMACSGPSDTPLIEERHTDGKGLLSINGASRNNLLSGDAEDVIFTFSKIKDTSKLYSPAFYSYFSRPYNLIHTLLLFIWDIVLEIRSRRRARKNNVWPRLSRGGAYPLMRAFTTVFMRDITTQTVIGDIFAGEVDILYATYVAYDELAHHSGVEDDDSFYMLSKLDRDFARIERAAAEAEREYHLIVLSDHGQSKGATFDQRYGITFEDLVKGLLPEEIEVRGELDTNEGWGHLSGVLSEISSDDTHVFGRTLNRAVASRTYEGSVLVGPEYADEKKEAKGKLTRPEDANVVVLASGNLGLIYFTDFSERMAVEEIRENFPNVMLGLTQHDSVGFVMVRSKEHGPLVIGKDGIYHLATDKVEGENPLEPFGPRAAQHLRRTDSFKYVPDILVNSFYDPETDEGTAFEHLIGFHGGLGGNQARPFLFFPSDWQLDDEDIVSAEGVYQQLVSWRDKYTQ